MLMEVALDIAADLAGDNYGNDGKTKTTNSSKAAEEFLCEFPMAKVIVDLDTHSSEGGFFLWRGDKRGDFETSPLLPVSPAHCQPRRTHGPPDSA